MKRSFLLTLLTPIVAAGSLHAASDYLLEIDGIKGESSDDRHSQSIEIASFSWSASRSSIGSATGGAGGGKAEFAEIHFSTSLSKAGPQLLLSCASTNPIPRATLWVRKSGSTREDYYSIQLENVLVSSYQQSSPSLCSSTTGDTAPRDEFSLNFTKITLSHTAADGTVTTGTVVRAAAQ